MIGLKPVTDSVKRIIDVLVNPKTSNEEDEGATVEEATEEESTEPGI